MRSFVRLSGQLCYTMKVVFCVFLPVWILVDTSFASNACSAIQFENVNDDTLHAKEGDNISLRFNLNTTRCSQQPNRTLIKVKKDIKDYCKVTLANGNCNVSDGSSSFCRCLAEMGSVEFSKVVDTTDNGNYTWVWSDDSSATENQHAIRFNVSFSALVIKGLQEGQVVRVGGQLTLMCVFTAVKFDVLALNFTCGHRTGQAGGATGPTAFSTLSFNPVTAMDKGVVCQCKAKWRQDRQLECAETSLNLTVYDAEPVTSGGMLVVISVIFASALSAVLTYIVVRGKVKLRDFLRRRRHRMRAAAERSALATLPTLHCSTTGREDSYDNIPDTCMEPSAPEGFVDGNIAKRIRSLSRPKSHLRLSEALTSFNGNEETPNTESADSQAELYMYLEPRISAEVNSSQLFPGNAEIHMVDILFPVYEETAASSLAPPEAASVEGRRTPVPTPRVKTISEGCNKVEFVNNQPTAECRASTEK